MKKRIFSRVLALVMALTLLSTTAFADVSFTEFQTAIDKGESIYQDTYTPDSGATGAEMYKVEVNTNADGQRDVKLWDDVVYAGRENKDYSTNIQICNDGRRADNVVIDLNGHKIDGGNNDSETPSSETNVISVWGNSTLTVKDTSDEQSGTITGGSRTNAGSGVYVLGTGATFNFESGNISQNVGGPAVAVYSGAEFNMSGGNITDNRCAVDNRAGGVSIHGGASSATITGGNISRNEGGMGGGISIYSNMAASNTISGVTMEGNESRSDGGAIYIWGGNVAMDNLTIKNNKAENNGGAIWISEEDTTPWSHVSNITYERNNTLSGNTASGEESNVIYVHGPEDDYTISVDETGLVRITDSEGRPVNAVLDGNGDYIRSGMLAADASLEFHGEFSLPPVQPDNDDNNPGDDTTIPNTPQDDVSADDAATTTIEDEETPLAGLISTAELLEALRQYEGIEDVELPEDFQWADHDYAQAIFWGLAEALVIDTEDAPLDPDEIVTVALLREVLENFVEYKGADLTVAVDGEDDMLVMDLGERLTVFYGELEAALAAQAA